MDVKYESKEFFRPSLVLKHPLPLLILPQNGPRMVCSRTWKAVPIVSVLHCPPFAGMTTVGEVLDVHNLDSVIYHRCLRQALLAKNKRPHGYDPISIPYRMICIGMNSEINALQPKTVDSNSESEYHSLLTSATFKTSVTGSLTDGETIYQSLILH